MVSQWKYEMGYKNCYLEFFESDIKAHLYEYSKDPSVGDCHYVPQVEYVFSASRDRKYCKHVLEFSNLTSGFNALMRSFDIPLTLEHRSMPPPKVWKVQQCDLAAANLSS